MVKTSGDGFAKVLDGIGGAFQGVSGDLAQDCFEFCEHLLNGVEIGTVCREIDKNGAAPFDGFSHASDLMNRDIVHEHNVAAFQSWSQKLFDISPERFAVHCPFEHERRLDTVVAQRRDERRGFPVTVQHLLDQPLAARRAAVETGDSAGYAGFIDEDEPFWIKPRLPPAQGDTPGGDVRPILLGGVQAFF